MGSGFSYPWGYKSGKNAWWEVFLRRFVEPLPLQVFPREIRDNAIWTYDDDGREVRVLQIMTGQEGLLEELAHGDLFELVLCDRD